MRNAAILFVVMGAAALAGACSDGVDQRSLTGLRHSTPAAGDGDEEVDQAAPPGSSSETAPSAQAVSAGPIPSPADAGADAAKIDCVDGVASPGSGKHHAGDDCLGCHDTQSKRWTVAGTLYSAATGGTAVAGATIEVVDATGKVVKLTTYTNGNFYTTTALTKPLKVRATKCPQSLPMVAAVDDGSCNGCHGAAMRVHL